ncbi:RNase H-like protein 3 [Elsinoe australis]|uniref:RNase H-like protein 3 n=1 Tax=Elsinoe australis TaxID=40998 RepID=A0A4U7AUN8_9PEZI|nr:RNase H-like protein 3 [Elsinoe australis]
MKAIQLAIQQVLCRKGPFRTMWIFTDSQQAIKMIQNQRVRTSCLEALQALLQSLEEARRCKVLVRIRWMPAHKGNIGSNLIDRLAKQMTEPEKVPTTDPAILIRETKAIGRLMDPDIKAREARKKPGQAVYTYNLDWALPGRHTKLLYDGLSRQDATILAQARTGHSHLNSYVARINPQNTKACDCGEGTETAAHMLLMCKQWDHLRQPLKVEAGPKWGDMSHMSGGWSSRWRRHTGQPDNQPKDKWRPSMKMVKVSIQFLKQTTGMQANNQQHAHLATQDEPQPYAQIELSS